MAEALFCANHPVRAWIRHGPSNVAGVLSPSLILRDDLITLLASIGIVLPRKTKLPDDELMRRLSQALDAAQELHELVESLPLVPSNYGLWSDEGSLMQAATAENPRQQCPSAKKNAEKSGTWSSKENTFKETRQVVFSFAHGVMNGSRHLCLMDDARIWGVYVRIVEVRKVKDKPLFIILYKDLHSTETHSFFDQLHLYMDESDDPGQRYQIASVRTTDLERMTMLKLFRQNAKRLPLDYLPMDNGEALELGLKASFVFPLQPLHLKDIGKLTSNTGCEVCGDTKISRCVQCLSISYCSTACQKEDWKYHKPTCRSLKGGSWGTLTFENPQYRVTLDNIAKLKKLKDENKLDDENETRGVMSGPYGGVAPDIHDGKMFLAKLQISIPRSNGSIYIYDRQRSFEVYWWRRTDSALFDAAADIMGEPLKIYRWAKRVGDYELSVCLDRSPAETPVW